jgi:serine/threonine protein kinase
MGTAFCPKCKTGYRLSADNLGHRSICVKCGQYFHLLPEPESSETRWLDTTAALNELASRVWERGLDLRVGQVVLGVYVVQEILGRGGLGQVFKVRHRDWQKELALKLPYRNVMEPKYFQSLRNEAETWVAMGLHPHVVSCYYVRPLMGVPSIFMEYVSGGSLNEFMEVKVPGEPPPLYRGEEGGRALRLLDLCIQAARGLEYAHGRGVLHLDIKPQNLMVEEDTGRLLVTDFGLARAARDTEDPSDSASLWPGDARPPGAMSSHSPLAPWAGGFGTPQYMSPEASEKAQPSASFDLWSLALTVLELFLGQRPWEFGGTVGAALDQYLQVLRPAVPIPKPLEAYLRQALDADPAKRWQTASEVAEALGQVYASLAGREYPRPKPWATPDSADSLNNRAVSLLDLGRPEEAEKLWKEALREDPGHLASFFNLSLCRYRRKGMSPEAFQGRLDDLIRLASGQASPDLPLIMSGAYLELGLIHEAAAALASYDGPPLNNEARRLTAILERSRRNPEQAERMRPAIFRISRVGQIDDEGPVRRLLAPLLATAREAVASGDYVQALERLREARRLPQAVGSDEMHELWRSLYGHAARTGLRDVRLEKGLGGDFSCELAASDGSLLVLAGNRRLLFVKKAATPAPASLETKLADPPTAVALAPGGAIAAALTEDGHLWLFNPETGTGAGQALAHSRPGRALSFSPDGKRLFTAGDDGDLKMWDTGHGYLDKGTPLLVRKLSDYPLQGLCVTPNGRLISVTDGLFEYRLSAEKMTGPVRSIPLGPEGAPPRTLRGLSADPFNRYLISVWPEGLGFHPLFDTDWRPELSGLEGSPAALAISPDARLWALALSDGRLLAGLAPGEAGAAFLPMRRLESGPIGFLCFATDGSALMGAGRDGLAVFGLDWNLEPAQSQGWDKKAELILSNFLARNREAIMSEELSQSFREALALAGLPGLDPAVASNRLREAILKRQKDI